jgi:hypothetical protein
MYPRILFSAAVLLAGAALAPAQDNGTALTKTRKAVERSLPFLEKEGVAWIKKNDCASCHNFTFLLWSHHVARAHGIPVDKNKLADWTAWMVTFSRAHRGWFQLTSDSLKQLRDDGVPATVLAKLNALIDKPFRTDKELLADLGKALPPEELDRYQAAVMKRSVPPGTH